MPRSAVATGLVDYVLPPAEMLPQLIAYVAHAFGRTPRPVSLPAPKAGDVMKKVFYPAACPDRPRFFAVQANTINRRVERRMAVHQIERLGEYVLHLQKTPAEVEPSFAIC